MKELFLTEFDSGDRNEDYGGLYNRKIRGRMKKRLTLTRRKMYNMAYKKDGERLQEVYVKKLAICPISPET